MPLYNPPGISDLTGPITSVGSATAIASQTGTGTKFVMDTSPTLVTPILGVASGTSLTLSSLTSGAMPIASTAGLLIDSTLGYNATLVNSAPGVSNSIPSLFSGTRTSLTGSFPWFKSFVTVTPGQNNLGALVNQTAIQARASKTGSFSWDYITGADLYASNDGTGRISSVNGMDAFSENKAAGIVDALIGGIFEVANLHASAVSTLMAAITVDPRNNGATTQLGTSVDYFAFRVPDAAMDLGSMANTNRYELYLGTMAGTPSGLDYAIRVAATQPSYLSGSLGVGVTPTTKLHVSGTGAGLFTLSTGGTYSGDFGGVSSFTAKATGTLGAMGFAWETIDTSASIAAGAYSVGGGSFTARIANAVIYPATSSLIGLTGSCLYAGATGGSIDSVIGLVGLATHSASAGTGGVINTLIVGVEGLVVHLENTGTTPLSASLYAATPITVSGVTITVHAGVYIPSQKTTQITTGYGIYQTGTDGNFFGGKFTTYGNVTTAGWGVPGIYAHALSPGNTAANASVATYTVGAADGTFDVSGYVYITTATTHSFTVTCAYTDPAGNARVLTLPFTQLAGVPLTTITNVTGVGPYEGVVLTIRCKASTTITFATAAGGTYTAVNYDVLGLAKQVG